MTKVVETSALTAWIAAATKVASRVNAKDLQKWIAANSKEATITPPVVIIPDPLPIPDPIPVTTTGYPDATNTGPLPGAVFKRVPQDVSSGPGWHYDPRGWITVDGPGTLFYGFAYTCALDVVADNVTISNCKCSHSGDWAVAVRHAKNTKVILCEFYGLDKGAGRMMEAVKDIYGDEQGTQVIGCHIYNVGTGVQIDNGLIADNYMHDFGIIAGDHINGTTSNGTNGPLTIRHNTIFNEYGQTDAISLFQDFGPQHDRLIENNLVAGGGYCIYGGQNDGKPATSNIVIRNNRVSTRFYPRGGAWDWLAAWNPAGVGNVLTGNVWHETGLPI